MKKTLLVGLICLGVGGGLAVGGFIGSGCNTSVFGGKSVKNTHTVTESFTNISVDVLSSNIQILPSADNVCKVVCKEQEKARHAVWVENGCLQLKMEDDRAWYDHIGISFTEKEVIVYLPPVEYQNITVSSASGDVEIDGKFTFTNMDVKSVSGEIEVGQVCVDGLKARSTSGDINLDNVTASQDIATESTSGEIELENVTCKALTVKSTSGDVEMSSVLSSGKTEIKTVSGRVELTLCDSASYDIKTSSGSVRATFRTAKQFSCQTSSGRITAPHSTVGGVCRVETSSGNIHLSVLG